MPVPMLKTLSEKYNVSISDAEDCWELAKKEAKKKFKKENEDYWKYVTGITKKCIQNKAKPKYKEW